MEINLQFLQERMKEIMNEEERILARMNYLMGAKNECQFLMDRLTERTDDEQPQIHEDSELSES